MVDRRAAVLATVLVLVTTCASAQPESRFADAPRVVAVADVHGAYGALTGLLEATGIVDADLTWAGGRAHLVSLGDLLDRGPKSRAVMDLLMRLQTEAERAGGRVHVLLGNHELMNLMGDLRYVSPAEFAAFADDEPAGARQAAHARFAAERAGASEQALEAAFEQQYPSGYFGHRAAFGPDGEYGSWLLTLPALVVVNDTAFVHGGLPELVAGSGTAVNAAVERNLRRYIDVRARLAEAGILPRYDMQDDVRRATTALEGLADRSSELAALLDEFVALADAPELGLEGPLWYRGSVYCSELLERPVLEAALEKLGASAAVVGHTPTGDRRVHALHDGKLVMLDTGMLAEYYDGRPAALVLEGGERRVRYLAPEEDAEVERGALLAYGLSEPELLRALRAAVSVSRTTDAPDNVRLMHDGTGLQAVFYGGRNAAAERELAAFALDRMLGLGLVPPTVARELDGEAGALQLRYPDNVTEAERLERRLPLGWCPIEPQAQLMHAFDLLTANTGRTRQTLHYRNDVTNVVLVGHAAAFGTRRELPGSLDGDVLALPAPLIDALSALDESGLETELGEWLNRRALRALLARRDALVELAR